MSVPEMGMKAARSSLADALFTPVQQRVLGLLFGQPDRRFQSAEIIRLAEGGTGAAHRQLARLEAAGLLSVTRLGNQKHYQARPDSPLFPEPHGLVTKTVGLATQTGGLRVDEDELLAEVRTVGSEEWEQAVAEAERTRREMSQLVEEATQAGD